MLAHPDGRARYVWGLGLLNGLLAILIVNGAYTLLNQPGIWLIPWTTALPYGLVVT